MIKLFRNIRQNLLAEVKTSKYYEYAKIKIAPSLNKYSLMNGSKKNIWLKWSCLISMLICLNCKQEPQLPDPLKAGWNNKSVCEVVEDNPKLRVLKCTFAPGDGHERHYHAAHFGYTIKGSKFRIKDTTGIREVNVPTGTEFYNDGIEWHEVLNIGDSTAVFLIMEPKA